MTLSSGPFIDVYVYTGAGFIDQVSGGDVAKRLAKMPELEITVPNRHDRLILTAEVQHREYNTTLHVV